MQTLFSTLKKMCLLLLSKYRTDDFNSFTNFEPEVPETMTYVLNFIMKYMKISIRLSCSDAVTSLQKLEDQDTDTLRAFECMTVF